MASIEKLSTKSCAKVVRKTIIESTDCLDLPTVTPSLKQTAKVHENWTAIRQKEMNKLPLPSFFQG